jgi:hypothetical protein
MNDIKNSVRCQVATAVSCEVAPCALVYICITLAQIQADIIFRVKCGSSMFLRHYFTIPLCSLEHNNFNFCDHDSMLLIV